MIRSNPNPPMGHEDILLFRSNVEKHLSETFSEEEARMLKDRREKEARIAQQIIANCGGRNPILGY